MYNSNAAVVFFVIRKKQMKHIGAPIFILVENMFRKEKENLN